MAIIKKIENRYIELYKNANDYIIYTICAFGAKVDVLEALEAEETPASDLQEKTGVDILTAGEDGPLDNYVAAFSGRKF